MLKYKELLDTVITLTQVNSYFTKVLNENISKFGLNLTDFSVLDLLLQKGEQTTQKIGEKTIFKILPLQIEKINEIFSDFTKEDLVNLNHLLKKFNF